EICLYEPGNWDKALPPIHAENGEMFAFSDDGKSLIIGRNLRIWDVTKTPATLDDKRLPDSEGLNANSIVVSHDGRFMAATARHESTNRTVIYIWREYDPQPNRRKPQGAEGVNRPWQQPKQLDVEPYSVVGFSPDGRYLASVGGDAAHLWDLSNPDGPREVSRFVEDARLGRFSPDGKWLITGNRDGTISKWPILTDQEIARLEHDDKVNTLAFSPDGRWVATASNDQTVRVFNVNDWTPVETPKLGMKHP